MKPDYRAANKFIDCQFIALVSNVEHVKSINSNI